METIKILEGKRWFIWTIVAIIVILGSLASYITYTSYQDDSDLVNGIGLNHLKTSPPHLLSVAPNQASIGDTVTLTVTHFSPQSFVVKFDDYFATSNNKVSSDGKTITFTVPDFISPFCGDKPGQVCVDIASKPENRTYKVSIFSNNQDSNSLPLIIIPKTTSLKWKTYTNSQYRLELQYPELTQDRVEVLTKDNGVKDISFEYFDKGYNDFTDSFDIFVDSNKSGDTLEQWFAKNVDYNNILKNAGTFKFYDIPGGRVATLRQLPLPDLWLNSNLGPIGGVAYLMPNSHNYVFTLSISQDPGNESVQDYLDTILNSFKFLQ